MKNKYDIDIIQTKINALITLGGVLCGSIVFLSAYLAETLTNNWIVVLSAILVTHFINSRYLVNFLIKKIDKLEEKWRNEEDV